MSPSLMFSLSLLVAFTLLPLSGDAMAGSNNGALGSGSEEREERLDEPASLADLAQDAEAIRSLLISARAMLNEPSEDWDEEFRRRAKRADKFVRQVSRLIGSKTIRDALIINKLSAIVELGNGMDEEEYDTEESVKDQVNTTEQIIQELEYLVQYTSSKLKVNDPEILQMLLHSPPRSVSENRYFQKRLLEIDSELAKTKEERQLALEKLNQSIAEAEGKKAKLKGEVTAVQKEKRKAEEDLKNLQEELKDANESTRVELEELTSAKEAVLAALEELKDLKTEGRVHVSFEGHEFLDKALKNSQAVKKFKTQMTGILESDSHILEQTLKSQLGDVELQKLHAVRPNLDVTFRIFSSEIKKSGSFFGTKSIKIDALIQVQLYTMTQRRDIRSLPIEFVLDLEGRLLNSKSDSDPNEGIRKFMTQELPEAYEQVARKELEFAHLSPVELIRSICEAKLSGQNKKESEN